MSTMVEKAGKAHSFHEVFERKGPGEHTTHYCPGCGHGTIQKLIAATIDELGIQDRTIFLSPVGCAVFAYYYYDTGNIQCSHGRAPAVATGVKRVHKDAIVISYQGDGDLAGIGMTEIVHAANRGEPITVFFINNAIYGMTGGQMAPTTPLGRKTLTTPFGRDLGRDGRPIGMAELMAAIAAPVYIERCSVATPAGLVRTRKAVRKALRNQIDGKGFSFVEILSPCPTNWNLPAVEARAWMEKEMHQLFPPGLFRDVEGGLPEESVQVLDDQGLEHLLQAKATVPALGTSEFTGTRRISVAGFGGQGVLSAGELLATCGMAHALSVSWLPSYGPEMRGGSAHVSVIISDEEVGSPLIDRIDVLLAMNRPSLDLFEDQVAPGGLVVVNSSIVDRPIRRTDIREVRVPATEIAREAGLASAANVVMVTACLMASGMFSLDTLRQCMPAVLRKKAFLEMNLALVEKTLSHLEEGT
jgi:2-oxoisovalerate ferredoxin oxidoreductase beta subunit